MKTLKNVVATSLFAAGIAASATASAGICTSGFLADVACIAGVVTPQQARALDGLHRIAGRPLNAFNPMQQGGFRPVPTQAVPMGNRCLTPYYVSAPGPLNPVGSPCFVGADAGYVVQ